ncbi:6-bladed beta-propeller [Aliifodinibius salicampi]|uniref:6-bladed beta-propeller n=1 Tax=Fodinibius salicampi TaxID=1920655 RepID=A0ABT3PWM8_9BACT|nr:6-bladed beta-propeller [Fodinibius salicampi]MCW9712256.1 6-bladed beta-propeller [Fodinibius salicampi]
MEKCKREISHSRFWIWVACLAVIYSCAAEKDVEIPEHVEDLDNLTVHSPDMEPTREIVLEEEVTYEDAEVIRGSILINVEVDEQGRVYIPDYQAKVVHAYNADGSYLDSIGRQGRGPGEFQMIWKIRVANGNLHVLDYMYQKMSVFDLQAMDHIRDVSLSLNEETDAPPSWLDQTRKKKLSYKPIDFYVRSDGNYLIFFGDEAVSSVVDNVEGRTYEVSLYDFLEKKYLKHDLLSFAWTGQTLIDQEGETVMFRVPYKRSSRFAYSGKELIHGWTEDLHFKTYNEEGQYQRAFFHPDPEIPLELEDALARYQNSDENVVKAIRNDTLPETWPAFNTIKPDDEHRLWVSVYTDDLEMYEWWVLDAENGELLTRFEWPKEKQIEVIKSGKLYTRERDKETGLEEVVRYDIKLGEQE